MALAPQDPRDRVKTGLSESQCPTYMRNLRPNHARRRSPESQSRSSLSLPDLSLSGVTASEAVQGHEQGTYVALSRSYARKGGMTCGGRPLWLRSPRSSPRAGKPSTWRRGTGVRIARSREVREMRNAETVLAIIHERGAKGLPLGDVYRQVRRDGHL